MFKKSRMGVAVLLALSGCDSTSDALENPRPEPTLKGYGQLEFGQSLGEVLTKTSSYEFNPAGLSDCFANMATEGCFMSPREDTSLYTMVAGIPYGLGLEFSQYDKLGTIRLTYSRENQISREQCLDIYERTLDWVNKDIAPLADDTTRSAEEFENRTTATGVKHRIGKSDNGFFVGTVEAKFAGGRRVWPFVSFIIVDGSSHCDIDVNFTDTNFARPEPEDAGA